MKNDSDIIEDNALPSKSPLNKMAFLGTEETGKLLWKFSIPAMTGMIVNALYNVIDSVFVGHGVGPEGLAAVTLVFPIMILMMGFGMLIGVGTNSLISLRIGQQKLSEAEKVLGNAFALILCVSLFMTTILLIFIDEILYKLGATGIVFNYAKEFMHIIVMGSLFQYIGFGMNHMIRSVGNPNLSMVTMIIGAVLNSILNPIFIFGMHLGVKGSALATIISMAVTASITLYHFIWGKKLSIKLKFVNISLNLEIVKSILHIGVSPFLLQVSSMIVIAVANKSLSKYGGDMAIASMGIINRYSMLIYMPIFGIAQGAQPLIGFNYGAKNYARVISFLKKALVSALYIGIVGCVITMLFTRYIVLLFNTEPNLVAIAEHGMRITMCLIPLATTQLIGANYFQAVGKPNLAIILNISKQIFILLPLIYILPGFFQLEGIWYSFAIADFLASILTASFLLSELRSMRKLSSISVLEPISS